MKAHYPVLISSGVKSQAVRALFESEGVFAYLVKPVPSDLLLEKVEAALNHFSGVEKLLRS